VHSIYLAESFAIPYSFLIAALAASEVLFHSVPPFEVLSTSSSSYTGYGGLRSITWAPMARPSFALKNRISLILISFGKLACTFHDRPLSSVTMITEELPTP